MGLYRFTPTSDGRWQTTAPLTVGGQTQEVVITLDAAGYAHLNARGCTCRLAAIGLDGVLLGGVDDCRVHGFPRLRVALPRHRTRRGPARHRHPWHPCAGARSNLMKVALTSPHPPRYPHVSAKCPGHQRHWFTQYGVPGSCLPYCVRCGSPNPRWQLPLFAAEPHLSAPYCFTRTPAGHYETVVALAGGKQPREVVITLNDAGYTHLHARGCTCYITTICPNEVILDGVAECPVHGPAATRSAELEEN